MAKGAREVKRRLTALIGDISQKKSYAAATAAAIVIQGEAAVRTPVDTSNLINSQFRRVTSNAHGAQAFIGYTAAYAFSVHEGSLRNKGKPRDPNDPSRGNVWDPAGEPGFLENAALESRPAIDSVVKKAMGL